MWTDFTKYTSAIWHAAIDFDDNLLILFGKSHNQKALSWDECVSYIIITTKKLPQNVVNTGCRYLFCLGNATKYWYYNYIYIISLPFELKIATSKFTKCFTHKK